MEQVAATCVWDARAELGEGLVWLEQEQALYFVDGLSGKILRYSASGGGQEVRALNSVIGFIAPRVAGGFIAGVGNRLCLLDGNGEFQREIACPEPNLANSRFNDGKVDPSGRLWAGTLDSHCAAAVGSLYCVHSDLSIRVADQGYWCTNGPAISADRRTLYHADSLLTTIYAFDLDIDTGALSNKRVFVKLAQGEGFPDGMTVDADNRLWVAHFGGSRVTAFRADGSVDRIIRIPAPHVTTCAFGGKDLGTLYIATARVSLTPEQIAEAPLSGGLFAVEGVGRGLPTPAFAG